MSAPDALDAPRACVHPDTRAIRVCHVGGLCAVVLPVASAKTRHVVQQRPDWAEVVDVAAKIAQLAARQVLRLERVDVRVTAALDEIQHFLAGNFLEIAHAALAVNAALLVQHDEIRQCVVLVGVTAGELEASLAITVLVSAILQLARAALIASRAIERVIEQGELHHPRLGFFHCVRCGFDDHAVRHSKRATGDGPGKEKQFGLPRRVVHDERAIRVLARATRIHEAHPARANGRQVLVRAKIWHIETRVEDSIQRGCATGDFDFTVIDDYFRHLFPLEA